VGNARIWGGLLWVALFVIDNSLSMADKQNVLELSLPSFVTRLVNPLCVDTRGKPVPTQPASAADDCSSGTRELATTPTSQRSAL